VWDKCQSKWPRLYDVCSWLLDSNVNPKYCGITQNMLGQGSGSSGDTDDVGQQISAFLHSSKISDTMSGATGSRNSGFRSSESSSESMSEANRSMTLNGQQHVANGRRAPLMGWMHDFLAQNADTPIRRTFIDLHPMQEHLRISRSAPPSAHRHAGKHDCTQQVPKTDTTFQIDDDLLARFISLVDSDDHDHARRILEEAEGDLDRAVHLFFNGWSLPPSASSTAHELPRVEQQASFDVSPPSSSSAQLPSVGSKGHPDSCAGPCRFFACPEKFPEGCNKGESCEDCHFLGGGHKRSKPGRRQRLRMRGNGAED